MCKGRNPGCAAEASYDWVKDTIAITNRKLVQEDYLTRIGKVTALHPYAMILREKDLSDAEYEALAKEVLAICTREQVPCFMHSHKETARKLGCRNIHLPVGALAELKDCRDEFEQVSASCHSLEDVKLAAEGGATQIVLGTIFETDCKPGKAGSGLKFVREITDYLAEQRKDPADPASAIPVFAIGGISPGNLRKVQEAGARGGCMMSYLFREEL